MFKSMLRDRLLVSLLIIAIVIKVFSLNAFWVERYYTSGLYPQISGLLRVLLGWIPFSIGDVLYLGAFLYLVIKAWKLISLLAKRKVKEYLSWILFKKYLKLVLWIYIIFNLFWGLNYDRLGIAGQFGLKEGSYTPADLYELTSVIQQRLNFYGSKVDSIKRLELNNNHQLFREGVAAYKNAADQYSFLDYQRPSIKPSIFTHLGAYFGFTGYYNPFTGEAQLKTNVPVFLKPFIVCHEMGHQLGYAKENEANFSGFLSARVSDDIEFRYSAYYEMYGYAMRDLFLYNLPCAIELKKTEDSQIKKDNRAYRQYLNRTSNAIEPVMSNVYDRYLRMNNQPHGKESYNEVVGWLIAYMKKYGKEAL
jgi:hypothetical protein